MKVINKDAALVALKCKLRECEEAKDAHTAAITRCVIQIMTDMPEIDSRGAERKTKEEAKSAWNKRAKMTVEEYEELQWLDKPMWPNWDD